MKLSKALKAHENQWIAFQILQEAKDPEGEVVLFDANRESFRKQLRDLRLTGVYITYSGDLLPEGYAAMF